MEENHYLWGFASKVGCILEIQINIGLTTIARKDYTLMGVKVHDEENQVRNSTFLFTLGYRFDL